MLFLVGGGGGGGGVGGGGGGPGARGWGLGDWVFRAGSQPMM